LSRTASGTARPAALVLAIAVLACPTLAPRAGEIYKSVDAEGHVVYSDHLDASMAQQSPVQIQSTESIADDEEQAPQSPPALPDYVQPSCPDEGYLWTPGYWAWNAGGYSWTPGAWVQPPRVGVLWTPGYWEFVHSAYVFHRGYWAEHIGYYGGINYGFGYFGVGFAGGRWVNHSFAYNRAVSNVDARLVHNTYSETVHTEGMLNRVSYNGGPGGATSLMTAREKAFEAEKHFPPTSEQRQYSAHPGPAPALMPHMPISVYHSESSAERRDLEAAQKPASLNASALPGSRAPPPPSFASQRERTRTPPSARAPVQPTVARPSKPAATHPASSGTLRVMPLPKS
jgi:hypothetical protein